MKIISLIIVFAFFAIYGLTAQVVPFTPERTRCYPKQKIHDFKIGDTIFTYCFYDKYPNTVSAKETYLQTNCPILDSLIVQLKKDSGIALILNSCINKESKAYHKKFMESKKYQDFLKENPQKQASQTPSDEEKKWEAEAKYKFNLRRAQRVRSYFVWRGLTNCMICGVNEKFIIVNNDFERDCSNVVQVILTRSDSVHCYSLKPDIPVVLQNIYFDVNKWELLPNSYKELNMFAQYLNENPDVTIEISGHTDNSGDKNKNIILSQKRAESVKTYLLQKGVMNEIEAKGYGSSRPISSNKTNEGKAINRRIEVKIVEK